MKNPIGFSNWHSGEETPYLNNWVIVYPQGLSSNFCGKVKEISGNYAILNPFYGSTYFEKEGKQEIFLKKTLIGEDLRVPLINAAIEPITESSLENLILLENERIKRETKNQEKSDSGKRPPIETNYFLRLFEKLVK